MAMSTGIPIAMK